MPRKVTAKAGDSLCNIAFKNGFGDCKPLREEAANAFIVNRADDPGQVLPGEIVTVPDFIEHSESKGTEKKHKFVKRDNLAILRFVHGWIGDYELENADVLIALHACNTATDDAIFKGIKANVELIVVAPCCHQEIRPQMKVPDFLSGIFRHGIMLEREAETVTDGLRSLLLEKSGYSTKIFEFIATEHTPKNNMIIGTKSEKTIDAEKINEQIKAIKEFYGISRQRLQELL